jgi:hypothetical protein
MLSVWTKHLKTAEEKQKFADYLKNSKQLLDRLDQIIDGIDAGLERSEISPKAFENPNWAYLQAYQNGYRGAIQHLKTAISIDQEKK